MAQLPIDTREPVPAPAEQTVAATPGPPLPGAVVRSRAADVLPTLAVVTALVGLAAWGHSTDWTVPKFSALIGRQEAAVDDWCEEHNVPESQCIECHPNLLPADTDYGWCTAHGVAQCPLEHPDVAQLKIVPVVDAEDLTRAQRALDLRPRPENNSRCTLHQRRIQFASIEALEKAGVDIAVVTKRPIIEAVFANGEVVYDETQAAHLASRVAGTVWRVEKQIGDQVRQGEILVLVDAAEVGRAKAEFLQAIAQLRLTEAAAQRLKPLAGGAVAGRELREAEAAVQESQIRVLSAQQALVNLGLSVRADEFAQLDTEHIAERIQFLGLPKEMVASFASDSTTSNLYPLRSPLDGVIVARTIVAGEVVDTNTTLFGVADVRQMWLTLHVRQDDAKHLALGQKVLFRASDGQNEPEITGSLNWISTEVDDRTRTVKARANLPNNDRRLRANTFGTGRIVLREEPRAVVVPSEAVHWDGCCHVVFVRDKEFFQPDAVKFFHVRKVRPGVKDGDSTEIIAGLLPGEVIASKNSVLLEAQLLKSSLGAGCCGVHMSDE